MSPEGIINPHLAAQSHIVHVVHQPLRHRGRGEGAVVFSRAPLSHNVTGVSCSQGGSYEALCKPRSERLHVVAALRKRHDVKVGPAVACEGVFELGARSQAAGGCGRGGGGGAGEVRLGGSACKEGRCVVV